MDHTSLTTTAESNIEQFLRLTAERKDVNFEVSHIPGTDMVGRDIPIKPYEFLIMNDCSNKVKELLIFIKNERYVPFNELNSSFSASELEELKKTVNEGEQRSIILSKYQQGYEVVKKYTPLMLAIELDSAESLKIVKLLIEKGADVNHKSDDGRTALKLALNSFYNKNINNITDVKQDYKFLKVIALITNGADLRFSSDKIIFDFPEIVEEASDIIEEAWIKQCKQKILTRDYKNPRIKIKDWNILKEIAKKTEYKDDPELKETLNLFNISASESISDLLHDAQVPIFETTKGFITDSKLKEIGKTPDGKIIYTKAKETKEIIFIDRYETKPKEFVSPPATNPLGDPGIVKEIVEFLDMPEISGLIQDASVDVVL